MIGRCVLTALLLALAGRGLAAPVLTVDAPPALGPWTVPAFAAFTRATGVAIRVTDGQAGADILIATAPGPQVAEHEKLTLPYVPPAGAHVPADLKDDDGDWTALALTALSFTNAAAPDPAARDAMRLLLAHTGGAAPPGTPALLMSLACRGADFQFATAPDGGPQSIVVPYFIARLKSGRQPAAAAKLIDFLLSAPAQSDLPARVCALPARTDVTPHDPHAQLVEHSLSGVAMYTPDWHKARRLLANGAE